VPAIVLTENSGNCHIGWNVLREYEALKYVCQDLHGNAFMQVQLQNSELRLLLNSEDITSTIPAANDTNTNSTLVFFQRVSDNSILTLFSNGISITVTTSFDILNFVAAIPQEYQGLASGLLGNYNGDSSDDLMYANGTVIGTDSSSEAIHDFSQSCKP
jgi:hypothetical protein